MSQTAVADWYFDVISPFAYLQTRLFDRLPEGLEVRPKPVLLGAILSHWGQIGPAEIVPKRLHTYRMCVWTAARHDMKFRMPPRHPFNPLAALRILASAGPDLEMARRALAFVFAEGRALDEPAELAAFARELGLEGDASALAAGQQAKDALRRNTEEAIARGVFGVPTFHLDGENFWGDDASELFLAFAADRELFQGPQWRDLADLPVGVERQRKPA